MDQIPHCTEQNSSQMPGGMPSADGRIWTGK